MADFSIGEHFQRWTDKSWETHKEAGNQFFKECKYEDAISCYSDAFFIASDFERAMPFFVKEVQSHKAASTAMLKFTQIKALCDQVKKYLSFSWIRYLDKETLLRYPNLAGAICLANRSLSYMQLYKQRKSASVSDDYNLQYLLKQSKKDADKARKMCPTYTKGHHRYAEAQKLLGNIEEHNDVQKQLRHFSQLLASGMRSPSSIRSCLDWNW